MQSLSFVAIITKSALSDRLLRIKLSVMLFAFALHFLIIFLGCIIAIHFDMTLGLIIAGTFGVKFFFMLPNNREEF